MMRVDDACVQRIRASQAGRAGSDRHPDRYSIRVAIGVPSITVRPTVQIRSCDR
jgi:hypothetical protein